MRKRRAQTPDHPVEIDGSPGATTPLPDMTGTILAAEYLRQSEALNEDEAAVIRQHNNILPAAEAKGLKIVRQYRDNDVSATSSRPRPAYEAMLKAWEAHEFEAIICLDLDRLYRKPRDLEDLIDLAEKRGLKLYTVQGDADLATDNGRFYARMKAVVAKGEVERKSTRQRLRNQQDADNGRPYWRRRPFGFELVEGEWVIREDEAQAIRAAYDAIIAGERLSTICAKLNEAGFSTPAYAKVGGNPWNLVAMRQLLRSHRNMGVRLYTPWNTPNATPQETPASWEAIVSETTWRTANGILNQRAARTGRGGGVLKNLLSGIATCSVCGETVAATNSGSQGKFKRQYRCANPRIKEGVGKNPCVTRLADPIDNAVADYIVARLDRPDAPSLLLDDRRIDMDAITAERDQVRVSLDELATDFYVHRQITRAQFQAANEALLKRMDELESSMVHQGKREVLGELIEAVDTRETWNSLPLDRRRQVVRALVRVEVIGGRGPSFRLEPTEGD